MLYTLIIDKKNINNHTQKLKITEKILWVYNIDQNLYCFWKTYNKYKKKPKHFDRLIK